MKTFYTILFIVIIPLFCFAQSKPERYISEWKNKKIDWNFKNVYANDGTLVDAAYLKK